MLLLKPLNLKPKRRPLALLALLLLQSLVVCARCLVARGEIGLDGCAASWSRLRA